MNPWPIIGGMANILVKADEYRRPNFGQPGDIIVLTKPIGTQPAVNLKQTPKDYSISQESIDLAYELSVESMAHLNRDTAKLMLKYESHGATDITGFGLLGHAQNLASAQFDEVDLILDALPVIDKMHLKIDNLADFKVMEGYSAETSGGILCMLAPDKAEDFVKESLEVYGQEVWTVGKVVKGERRAVIKDDCEVISINKTFLHC